MDVSAKMKTLLDEAVRTKKRAQALGAFLKTGKARQFVEAVYAMRGETIEVYAYTYTSTVQLSVYVKELEGFKDARLAGILQAWEYMNPVSTRMSEDAASYAKTFTYTYEMPHDETNDVTVTVEVMVTASIKDESPTCQRVVVGMTDPKPQPIYKLVCEGEMDPTDATDVVTDSAFGELT
jgi:hypothetical protein